MDKEKQTVGFNVILRLLTDDEIKQLKDIGEEIPKCVIEIKDQIKNEERKKIYSYIFDIEGLARSVEIKIVDIGGLKCLNKGKNKLETVINSSMLYII